MSGQLPEAVADLLVRHRFAQRLVARLLATADLEPAVLAALEDEQTERIVKGALASPALERILIEALESPAALDLLDRVLQSREFERVLEQVASSPAIRAALTQQSVSFAEETAAALRARTGKLDDAAERVVRGRRQALRTAEPDGVVEPAYGGVVTRTIAFAVDAVTALVAFLTAGALLRFGFSLVGGLRPDWLADLLAAAGWILLVGGYFVFCWTVTGQTLGLRLVGLRVVRDCGAPLTAGRSILRFVGLLIAIVPLLLGFLPILFDRKRRGLHDLLAGTVVVRSVSGLRERSPAATDPHRG